LDGMPSKVREDRPPTQPQPSPPPTMERESARTAKVPEARAADLGGSRSLKKLVEDGAEGRLVGHVGFNDTETA